MKARDFIDSSSGGATWDENDSRYRYSLWRRWKSRVPIDGLAVFIGLNPSTADAINNDPTVTRCIRYAHSWGHGGMVMLNLFAFRATLPMSMKAAEDPVGPCNDNAILSVCREAGRVVCCWGNHGTYRQRGFDVMKTLVLHEIPLWHLGLTKSGEPRHPLYLRADLKPEKWSVLDRNLVARMMAARRNR